MTSGTGRLTEQPAGRHSKHHQNIRDVHLRELFALEGRGERLTVDAADVYLDYSKNRITDETVTLLVRSRLRLRAHRRHVRGEESTSRRSGRAPCGVARTARRVVQVDGERGARGSCRARPDGGLHESRAQRRMEGHTGKRIRNVVNIGIGGSDLGPVMACGRSSTATAASPSVRLEHRWVGSPRGSRLVRRPEHVSSRPLRRWKRPTPAPRALVAGGFGRPIVGRQALRRGLDQCRGSGGVASYRHVRLLGLVGGLLHGCRHRPLDDVAIGGSLQAMLAASTRWTNTFARRPSPRTCRC